MATSLIRICQDNYAYWCWTETDADRPGVTISTGEPKRTRSEAIDDARRRFGSDPERYHLVADGLSVGAALPPLPPVNAEAERRAAGVPGEMS